MHRDMLYATLQCAGGGSEEDYYKLCAKIKEYENHLKEVINHLQLDKIGYYASDVAFIEQLKEYLNKEHTSLNWINNDAISEMFQLTDEIHNFICKCGQVAIASICDASKEFIPKDLTK